MFRWKAVTNTLEVVTSMHHEAQCISKETEQLSDQWISAIPNYHNYHQKQSKWRPDMLFPAGLVSFHLAAAQDESWLRASRQCSNSRYLVPLKQNIPVTCSDCPVCLTGLQMTSCWTSWCIQATGHSAPNARATKLRQRDGSTPEHPEPAAVIWWALHRNAETTPCPEMPLHL